MARATFVKAARKDIYAFGKRVEYVSQKGKKEGQTLSKIDHTQPRDDQDYILIHKGESYYSWEFMYGGVHYSKTAPRQSQLTQSSFLSEYYSIQENIEDWEPQSVEEVESFVEEIREQLESLRDTCQDSFDNIPEQLQEAPAGATLTERIESLEETINDLECFECEYEEPDEEDINDRAAQDNNIDTSKEGWEDLLTEEMKENAKSALAEEWLEEKREELNDISFGL